MRILTTCHPEHLIFNGMIAALTVIEKELISWLPQSKPAFDAFDEIFTKSKTNPHAAQVIKSWADAQWFLSKPKIPEALTLAVFKVDGEINTDDFSPAGQAWSRPDIPLHAVSMLSHRISENTVETI